MSAAAAFAQCDRLRQVELDWFRSHGVSGFALAGYRVDPAAIGAAQFRLVYRYPHEEPVDWLFEVRRARVQFLPRGRFVFAWEDRCELAESVPALIIPALDGRSFVDLVAWHPKTGRLASLERRVGWLAGQEREADAPLVVFTDPLGWLAAWRCGVVIVHEAMAVPFLREQDLLQVADVSHGEALQAMLSKVRLPRIVVPASTLTRAAA